MILCISVLSVVTSPFSFIILLIQFFSFFLMNLASGLSILFIFSKNQLLVLLIFAIVFIISFSLISALIFMISFLLTDFVFSFSLPSCFKCRVRLSSQCFSCFLRYDCVTINLPLSTAFAESYRFGVIVFSLSFVSRNLLICFISSVMFLLFSNVLFNLHEFVFFAVFSL